jgi:hypothetical protein
MTEGIGHDFFDRACATATLRATAETAVNFATRARRSAGLNGDTDIFVGDDVAGTDDHGGPRRFKSCVGRRVKFASMQKESTFYSF